MNNKELYIFDMDGTLLDSMPTWQNLDHTYLGMYNVTMPDDFHEKITSFTLPECAIYFESLGVPKSSKEILDEIISLVEDAYHKHIPLKKQTYRVITELYLYAKTLCLLTTSEKSYAIPALKRLRIYDYFAGIHTSAELGLDKRTPEIYKTICQMYDTAPENTTVYEDTLFAVRSAKEAGCHVVAVYDEASDKHWEEISKIADATITKNI